MKKKLLSLLIFSMMIALFATNVSAYPGNGQGGSPDSPQSCLNCHATTDSADNPLHGQITYDLIRLDDNVNMVQPDGSLLFELDPKGGITTYRLIVGLSKEAFDGGKEKVGVAGWHFNLPNGIKMSLPYCMHQMAPGKSKVLDTVNKDGNTNQVYSDVKIAAFPDFDGEASNIIQMLAGLQNGEAIENKVYTNVPIHFVVKEGTPVASAGDYKTLPSPTVASVNHFYNWDDVALGSAAPILESAPAVETTPTNQPAANQEAMVSSYLWVVIVIGLILVLFTVTRLRKKDVNS